MSTVEVGSLHASSPNFYAADNLYTNDAGELWITNDGKLVAVYARGCWTAARLIEQEPPADPKGQPE